jgi:uncharacterized protein
MISSFSNLYSGDLLSTISGDDVDIEHAEMLLETGAKTEIYDSYFGLTPLLFAIFKNNFEFVKLLIKYKANLNTPGKKTKNNESSIFIGSTPLEMAVIYESSEITKLLLDSGAKYNISSKHGNNLLHTAASCSIISGEYNLDERKSIIELLLLYKINVNAKNKDLETPLMCAVKLESIEIIKLLVKAGAKINEENKAKKTALMIAAEENNKEVYDYLKSLGAK